MQSQFRRTSEQKDPLRKQNLKFLISSVTVSSSRLISIIECQSQNLRPSKRAVITSQQSTAKLTICNPHAVTIQYFLFLREPKSDYDATGAIQICNIKFSSNRSLQMCYSTKNLKTRLGKFYQHLSLLKEHNKFQITQKILMKMIITTE